MLFHSTWASQSCCSASALTTQKFNGRELDSIQTHQKENGLRRSSRPPNHQQDGHRGQPGSQHTPSSATRQLFTSLPSPLLDETSPVKDADARTPLNVPRPTLLKSIAKKKAEIAAAAKAAKRERTALEATAGLALASGNHPNSANLPGKPSNHKHLCKAVATLSSASFAGVDSCSS